MDISRRDLLKVVSASSLGGAGVFALQGLTKQVLAQNQSTPLQIKKGEMLYRQLGRTKEQISVLDAGAIKRTITYGSEIPRQEQTMVL